MKLTYSIIFVMTVSSLITILQMIMNPIDKKEGFVSDFNPGEQAKLKLLRDNKNVSTINNGITLNMPVWINRELRITNADSNPSNGGIRFQRTDGKTAIISVAPDFQADQSLFSDEIKSYFMIPNPRDLVIKNGDGSLHRTQPYSLQYKEPVPNTFLSGLPKDPVTGNLVSAAFLNIEDAYRECTRVNTLGGKCGGITKDPKGTFTIRVGDGGLRPSPYGESSYALN